MLASLRSTLISLNSKPVQSLKPQPAEKLKPHAEIVTENIFDDLKVCKEEEKSFETITISSEDELDESKPEPEVKNKRLTKNTSVFVKSENIQVNIYRLGFVYFLKY